ncbi:MAG TPA: hypothetical protein P5320_07895 [Bacteroidales bacterium]|nr:hypothetical protein [Bacteroidales bacterium]HOK75495.1 hypothetical protein [Bacteroidales bacterium]HOM40130.1 hypothetical protein [Bacteroidales bacterium]HOU30580.1 hypothetical protein [Bacteroidales bacterium]HPP93244.1 hypothetical protein [Bacteroidales bacterium]
MFIKILIISLILVAAAIIFLGVKIFFTRKGKFPEYHVGSNHEMRKRGITCAKSTDIGYSASGENGCAACRQGIL